MSDPAFINASAGAPAYAANELRRLDAVLLQQAGTADRFGARQGVHPGGTAAVSLSGTTVTVQHTKAIVYPGLTTLSGPYRVAFPSTTHELDPADGSNPRKDIIVLRVFDDDEDSLGQRTAVTEYIAGSPASSPVEPLVPAGAMRMATIDVPAGGTPSPTLTYNAPFTVSSGGVIPVRNDAELPGTAGGIYDGLVRWNQDTDELQVHNGASTWETVGRPNAPLVASGTVSVVIDELVSADYLGTTRSIYEGTAAVVFPVGRFTTTPAITVTPRSSVPGVRVMECSITDETSTGFTVYVSRLSDQVTTVVNWIAVQS